MATKNLKKCLTEATNYFSIYTMIKTELTLKELEAIFDVLNVYEPQDISHVYPEMGTDEFMKDVNSAWKKVLDILKDNKE